MLSQEDVSFVIKEISKILPDGYRSLHLFGSQASGEATKESDVDVLVISNIDNIYVHALHAEGHLRLDIHVTGRSSYHALVNRSRKNGDCFFLMALCNSIHLDGDREIELIDAANKSLLSGPPEFPYIHYSNSISSILSDVQGAKGDHELLSLGLDAFRLLAESFLWSNGKWITKGRSLARLVEQENKGFSKELVRSIDKIVKSADASLCVRMAEDIFSKYGGLKFRSVSIRFQ